MTWSSTEIRMCCRSRGAGSGSNAIPVDYRPISAGVNPFRAINAIYAKLLSGQALAMVGVWLEQDALDVLGTLSTIHRRLDVARSRAVHPSTGHVDRLCPPCALAERFPNDNRYRVIKGDCNQTIDGVLQELQPIRWAPTFAFLDQQGAEIHWRTIERLARFRENKNGWKTELWILMSPTMIARGVRGTNAEEFEQQVSKLYGGEDWLRIVRALRARTITADEYRQEMVNLLRFQLETILGYRHTHRIPMKMSTNKMTIFDMVFATDHDTGDRIMRHLYNLAAQREPEMMRRAQAAKAETEAEKAGLIGLFPAGDLEVKPSNTLGQVLWTPQPTWDPAVRDWWEDDDA
ncbi:three-Cys-motif partner protein TcmP [Mycobacterium riyadhense]|nr:three-Cys-motif partner protein TcmP [Mycobacterium riyadhense]